MHLSVDSYGIEPLDSAPDQHLVYRLQDVMSQPRGCETPHDEHDHNSTEHAQSSTEDLPHGQHKRVCFLSLSHTAVFGRFRGRHIDFLPPQILGSDMLSSSSSAAAGVLHQSLPLVPSGALIKANAWPRAEDIIPLQALVLFTFDMVEDVLMGAVSLL